MKAIVSNDENGLKLIAEQIQSSLNSSNLKYVSYKYGDVIKHPKKELYALPLISSNRYIRKVLKKLSEETKTRIQNINKKWFSDLNI
jgi:hypothetical protein